MWFAAPVPPLDDCAVGLPSARFTGALGDLVGLAVGSANVGNLVGLVVGADVGSGLGLAVGNLDGEEVGMNHHHLCMIVTRIILP